jgi:hypothetical protein
MGHAIPRQHPAVVLRSHFNLVRALLIAATVAVIGLSVAVVILATDDENVRSATAAQAIDAAPQLSGATDTADPLAEHNRLGAATRYDGGPEEGTSGLTSSPPVPGVRYDGGPEEGTSGLTSSPPAPGVRYDGGPEEGTAGQVTSQSASGIRYDGGPEEGSRGPGR